MDKIVDQVSANSDPQSSAAPLSKKAQKRAAKAERYAVIKLERRAKERAARKEKNRLIAEKRAAGELDGDEQEKRLRKKRKTDIASRFQGRVILDLGFDELMTDKEVNSLCSQLAYTYSANRQSGFPFSLLYTSLNGRTFTRLEGMSDASYRRWSRTEWWQEGYDRLWKGKAVSDNPSLESEITEGNPLPKSTPEPAAVADVQRSLVYLTADSEEELTELKEDEIYIIGGICDHNRYKNLCFNKANESGIRTARLPIGRYLAALQTRKVLTVNQVFEILLKWVESRDWEDALCSVIPQRKFKTGGKGKEELGNADETNEEEREDQGAFAEEESVQESITAADNDVDSPRE